MFSVMAGSAWSGLAWPLARCKNASTLNVLKKIAAVPRSHLKLFTVKLSTIRCPAYWCVYIVLFIMYILNSAH